MTITMIRPTIDGRHRLGRTGLIPVTAFVRVVRRNFIVAWFRPARHRKLEAPRHAGRRPTPIPAV